MRGVIWDWSYVVDAVGPLLRGLLTTVIATLAGSAIALALGLLIAIGRRSRSRVLTGVLGWVVEFVRGTPLLVQLFFLFYVLPQTGLTLSPLTTGIIALGINYSAYTAEVYRAGIEGVPAGQWEAGTALNMSTREVWLRIVLPQAVPAAVPVLANYVNQMFKDSALLTAITVMDLLNSAMTLGGSTYRYLEPVTLAGLMFLVVSYATSLAAKALEHRLAGRGGQTAAVRQALQSD